MNISDIYNYFLISIFFFTFHTKINEYLKHFWFIKDIKDVQVNDIKDIKDNSIEEKKIEIKYEDKYLNEIRKLNKEFVFTDEEKNNEEKKFLNDLLSENEKRINEINKQLNELENEDEYLLCNKNGSESESESESYDEENNLSKEEVNKIKFEKINELKSELEELKILNNTQEGLDILLDKAKESAKQNLINKRIEKLRDCHVIEKTPLGNVLMKYNNDRTTFEYYSDNTIPYRYLETVARKYVKMFNCRPIFIDMEEELKLYEEKLIELERKEKERELEKERKEKEKGKELEKEETKKNVFAKFKTYNKDAGTGRVNTAPPPKNSIPNKNITDKNTNEKLILKEKSNRYTYEGKFSNFSFIKKVERKAVDKKYAMTFANFKKMQLEKNKNK
jgi:hypothetical protein